MKLELDLQYRTAREYYVETLYTTNLELLEDVPLHQVKQLLAGVLHEALELDAATQTIILLDMKSGCYTVQLREKTQPKYLKMHIEKEVSLG